MNSSLSSVTSFSNANVLTCIGNQFVYFIFSEKVKNAIFGENGEAMTAFCGGKALGNQILYLKVSLQRTRRNVLLLIVHQKEVVVLHSV